MARQEFVDWLLICFFVFIHYFNCSWIFWMLGLLDLVNLRKEFDVALSVASILRVVSCCYCLGSLFIAFLCFPDTSFKIGYGVTILHELEVLLFRTRIWTASHQSISFIIILFTSLVFTNSTQVTRSFT